MSQFFKKAGVYTNELGKTVNVRYSPGGAPTTELKTSKETLIMVQKEQTSKPVENTEELLKKRVYDFSQSLLSEEEQLEKLIESQKALGASLRGAMEAKMEQAMLEKDPKIAVMKTDNPKGFALMQKLGGFRGGGLGKDEQGIKEFIKPNRKSKLGSSSGDGAEEPGEERSHKKLAENEQEILKSVLKWKKNGGYTTSADKLQRSEQPNSANMSTSRKVEEANVVTPSTPTFTSLKFIDMTGSAPKLKELGGKDKNLSGMDGTSGTRIGGLLQRLKSTAESLRAEQSQKQSTQLRIQKELVTLQDQLELCDYELNRLTSRQQELTKYLECVRWFQIVPSQPGSGNMLAEVVAHTVDLLNTSRALFAKYHVRALYLNTISHHLGTLTRQNPKTILELGPKLGLCLETLRLIHSLTKEQEWRHLDPSTSEETQAFADDLRVLFQRGIVPPLTRFVQDGWDHEDPGELLEFFIGLDRNLPVGQFYELFRGSVLEVLAERIQSWGLGSSSIYPHLWMQPWLVLIERDPTNESRKLYGVVQKKFRSILSGWKPGDQYAAKLLLPWKDILPQVMWEDFLYLDILPKVIFKLEDFDADPAQLVQTEGSSPKSLEPLLFMIEWSAYIPPELAVDLIDDYILPKIDSVVVSWQNSISAEDLSEWLEGWLVFFADTPEYFQTHFKECLLDLSLKHGGGESQQPQP